MLDREESAAVDGLLDSVDMREAVVLAMDDVDSGCTVDDTIDGGTLAGCVDTTLTVSDDVEASDDRGVVDSNRVVRATLVVLLSADTVAVGTSVDSTALEHECATTVPFSAKI